MTAELPMTEVPPKKSERLVSLDAFRGLTIAAMILVNNPGDWGKMYWPVSHAQWDGWTPTDFIFPFFLFIVGVAMTYSFDKRRGQGADRGALIVQVVRRTAILFLLGLCLHGFPNFRLIGPFILAIVGLEMLCGQILEMVRGNSSVKYAGAALIAIGSIWFLADLAHFNGPVIASRWDAVFPLANEIEKGRILRVPGVLQRIALCYLAASLILLFVRGVGARAAIFVAILLAYWGIQLFVHAPTGYDMGGGRGAPAGVPFDGALNDWIDVKLLGDHIYSERPDPEGLLSTLPAIATVLAGVLTAAWIRSRRTPWQIAQGLFGAGLVLILAGMAWGVFYPINKKIWTSSYVVIMSGWALVIFGMCYVSFDIFKRRKLAEPLVAFGMNAILVFVASGVLARLMSMIHVPWGDNPGLKTWIYATFFTSWIEPAQSASLAYAIVYIGFWLAILWPLYRAKLFWKI